MHTKNPYQGDTYFFVTTRRHGVSVHSTLEFVARRVKNLQEFYGVSIDNIHVFRGERA